MPARGGPGRLSRPEQRGRDRASHRPWRREQIGRLEQGATASRASAPRARSARHAEPDRPRDGVAGRSSSPAQLRRLVRPIELEQPAASSTRVARARRSSAPRGPPAARPRRDPEARELPHRRLQVETTRGPPSSGRVGACATSVLAAPSHPPSRGAARAGSASSAAASGLAATWSRARRTAGSPRRRASAPRTAPRAPADDPKRSRRSLRSSLPRHARVGLRTRPAWKASWPRSSRGAGVVERRCTVGPAGVGAGLEAHQLQLDVRAEPGSAARSIASSSTRVGVREPAGLEQRGAEAGEQLDRPAPARPRARAGARRRQGRRGSAASAAAASRSAAAAAQRRVGLAERRAVAVGLGEVVADRLVRGRARLEPARHALVQLGAPLLGSPW